MNIKEVASLRINTVSTPDGKIIKPHSIDIDMEESPFSSYSECIVIYPFNIDAEYGVMGGHQFGAALLYYLLDSEELPALNIECGGVLGRLYELTLPPDVHDYHVEMYHHGRFTNEVTTLMDIFYRDKVLLDMVYRMLIESEMMFFGQSYQYFSAPKSPLDAGGIVTDTVARNYFNHAVSVFDPLKKLHDDIIYPPYLFVQDVIVHESNLLDVIVLPKVVDYNDTIGYKWQTYYLSIP